MQGTKKLVYKFSVMTISNRVICLHSKNLGQEAIALNFTDHLFKLQYVNILLLRG